MKNTFVKVLSLVMALTMIMSTLVLTVSAEDAHAHTKGDVVGEAVPATCATYGYTIYVCEECGEEFAADVTPKLDHKYVDVPEVPATCTQTGTTAHSACELCGALNPDVDAPEVIETLDHEYVIKIKQGDCESDGEVYYECKNCAKKGAVLGSFNEADGHAMVYVITKAPDCKAPGTAKYFCADCDLVFDNIYVAPSTADNAHKWAERTKDGGCAEDYTETYCTVCGDIKNVTGAFLAHNFQPLVALDDWALNNDYTDVAKDSTCTEQGYVLKACTNPGCNEHDITFYEPLDHDFSGPSMHSETICTYKVCQRAGCNATSTVVADHVYAEYTEANVAAGLFVVTTAPKCTVKGAGTAYCTAAGCTASNPVTINPLNHEVNVYSCTAGCAAGACNDCTHAGRTVTCSRAAVCGYTATAVTTCEAHVADATATPVVVAPTCSAKGYSTAPCANAGCTKTTVVEGSETEKNPNLHTGFSFVEDSYKAPNCTANASIQWACADCDKAAGTTTIIDVYANYEFIKTNLAVNADALAQFLAMTGLSALPTEAAAVEAAFKATGHSNTEVAAVAATCMKKGNDAFVYCNHANCPDAATLAYDVKFAASVTEINPDAHTAMADSIITKLIPATCGKGLEIYYDCANTDADGNKCSHKNNHYIGERSDLHKVYFFNEDGILLDANDNAIDFMADAYAPDANATRIEKILAVAKTESKLEKKTNAVAPNCTTAGSHESFKCSVCEATVITECESLTCDCTVVAIPATGHSNTEVAYKAETCTENGNKAYTYCGNANCPDAATLAKDVVAAQNVILAHGDEHFEYIPEIDSTCTNVGRVEHYRCTVCDVLFAADYETVGLADAIIEDTVMARKGHNTMKVNYYVLEDGSLSSTYVGSACVIGTVSVIKCTSPACDGLLTWNDWNEDGKVDVLADAAVADKTSEFGWFMVGFVPATGHSFAEPVIPENYVYGTNLSESQILALPLGLEYANNCELGEIYYVACDCGEIKVLKELRAAGHIDDEGNAFAPSCGGAEDVDCKFCGTDAKDEDAHTLVLVTVKEETCTENGLAFWSCSVCGAEFDLNGVAIDDEHDDYQLVVDEIADVEADAEHIFGSHVPVEVVSYKAATSTTVGEVVIKCARCGDVTVELPMLDKTPAEVIVDFAPYHPELGELGVEAGLSNNSMIAVTVKVDVTDEDFTYYDFDLRLEYAAAALEFVSAEWAIETPAVLAVANKAKANAGFDGMNTLVLRSYITADTEDVVEISEDTVMVKLYFKVKTFAGMAIFTDVDVTDLFYTADFTVNNEDMYIEAAETETFFAPKYDINGDFAINGGDIVALIDMIYDAEAEYVAYADANNDGVIDVLDLELLENLLLTDVLPKDYIKAVFGVDYVIREELKKFDYAAVAEYDFDEDGYTAYDYADWGAPEAMIKAEFEEDKEAFLFYLDQYVDEIIEDAADSIWMLGVNGPEALDQLLEMGSEYLVEEVYDEYFI